MRRIATPPIGPELPRGPALSCPPHRDQRASSAGNHRTVASDRAARYCVQPTASATQGWSSGVQPTPPKPVGLCRELRAPGPARESPVPSGATPGRVPGPAPRRERGVPPGMSGERRPDARHGTTQSSSSHEAVRVTDATPRALRARRSRPDDAPRRVAPRRVSPRRRRGAVPTGA